MFVMKSTKKGMLEDHQIKNEIEQQYKNWELQLQKDIMMQLLNGFFGVIIFQLNIPNHQNKI